MQVEVHCYFIFAYCEGRQFNLYPSHSFTALNRLLPCRIAVGYILCCEIVNFLAPTIAAHPTHKDT